MAERERRKNPPRGKRAAASRGGARREKTFQRPNGSAGTRSRQALFYRLVPHNNGLVFAEKDRALFIARIHNALNNARTWGEFRSLMPRSEYSQIIRAYDEQGEPRPKSTDSFNAEGVAGWSDGDYPPWLQQEMDEIVPVDLLERFGARAMTCLNGDFYEIPPENARPMVRALKRLGYRVKRAQRLDFH